MIIKAIDAGNVCAVVLLDLSAAFDIVHHQILLQIMNRRFAGRWIGVIHTFVSIHRLSA